MTRTIPRSTLLAALILVVVCASGAAAVEGRVDADTLTGCRNTTTGIIDQVRPGSLPLGHTCGLGEVKVSWNKTGPRGPAGPAGATGPAGPQGPPGPAGASGLDVYDRFLFQTLADIPFGSTTVWCNPGDRAIGGGGQVGSGVGANGWLIGTHPVAQDQTAGWSASAMVDHLGDDGWTLSAWVICLHRDA